MELYLSSLRGARRQTGYKTRFVWDDSRRFTEVDRRTLRNRYRVLRKAGIDEIYVRWIIWDLVDTGTRAKRHNDKLEVSS